MVLSAVVHRKKRETVHIKKIIHTQNHFNEHVVIELVFKKNFINKKKTGGHYNIHPPTFQMSRKNITYKFTVARQRTTNHFFTFFNFTSDVHNKITIFLRIHNGLSRQHYPESTILEDTRRISHKMIINYPRNPYDGNDSRS